MIPSLNLVIGQTLAGKMKVFYAGACRIEALEAYEKQAGNADLVHLVHIREPRSEHAIRPAYVAEIAAEEAAAHAAQQAAAAEAEELAEEAAARGNASLAALELAEESHLPLRGLTGTGENGRILLADVSGALEARAAAELANESPGKEPNPNPPTA